MYYTNGYDRENERQLKSDEEAIGDKTMIGLVFRALKRDDKLDDMTSFLPFTLASTFFSENSETFYSRVVTLQIFYKVQYSSSRKTSDCARLSVGIIISMARNAPHFYNQYSKTFYSR